VGYPYANFTQQYIYNLLILGVLMDNSSAPKPNTLQDWCINVIPSLILLAYFSYFAYVHGLNFLTTGRLSSLFIVILETMVIFMVLIRQRPKVVTKIPEDWLVAVGMTVAPLLLMPSAVSHEHWWLQGFQIAGIIFSIGGLWTLSTSFGIVAAKRTLRSDGLYKYVRHPMYAGYTLSIPAYVFQNPNMINFLAFIIFFGFMFIRIQAEERLLSKDPAYADYMTKTKWRVLPGIW
jgi:protein-S-isoprenylcysteine O-methyltransferase Ste14